jgi:hypothetical protein
MSEDTNKTTPVLSQQNKEVGLTSSMYSRTNTNVCPEIRAGVLATKFFRKSGKEKPQ